MGCNQSQVHCQSSEIKRPEKVKELVIESLQNYNSEKIRVENRKPSNLQKHDNISSHQKNKITQQQANMKKLKYLKQSKTFVEMSIQTNVCIDKLLQTLAANKVLQNSDYKKLASINSKSLTKKQNRYKNLQIREQKAESKAALDLSKYLKRDYSQKGNLTKLIRNKSQDRTNNKENLFADYISQQEKNENTMKKKFTEKINRFKNQINSNKTLLQI